MSDLDRVLGDLLAEPARVADVPVAALPALLAQLAAVQTTVAARLAAVVPGASNDAGDHLLHIEEASERLAVTKDWLRRRPHLSFVVKLSDGVVRYSSVGIDSVHRGAPGHIALTEVRPSGNIPRCQYPGSLATGKQRSGFPGAFTVRPSCEPHATGPASGA
jgi:hypothetical protein